MYLERHSNNKDLNLQMQKKKIGLIIFWYSIGISPLSVNLVESLGKANYEVHIFIDKDSFQQSKINFSNKNIILHLVRNIPSPQIKFKNRIDLIRHRSEVLLGFYRYCRNISALIDEDFKWLIGADAMGIIAANFVSSKKKIPLIYYNLELLLSSEAKSLKDKLIKFFEKKGSQKAAFTIIQDDRRAEYLAKDNNLKKENFIYIPTSVSKENILRSNYLRKKFKIAHDKKIILCAGEMVPWSMNLEIAQAAQEWSKDLVLVLHSSRLHNEAKEYLKQIKAVITKPDKVYFSLEPVEWHQLPKIISAADIGLVFYGDSEKTGHYEIGASSGKLASYLQVGLPVITSDFPSFKNIVDQYHIGKYAHCVDQIGSLAKKILRNYNFYRYNSKKCFKEKYDYNLYFPDIINKMKEIEDKNNKFLPKSVSARHYTKEYFLDWGEYPTFLKTKGEKIFLIHERIINFWDIKSGMKVLDIGCGRGELIVLATKLGAEATGIDFSKSAINFSRRSLRLISKKARLRTRLIQGDFKEINLPDNYYDRVFLGDVIEHLRPWEVDVLFSKVRKAMKKNGQIIIHTWPNKLVVDYGFPIYNFWQNLRHKPLIESRTKIEKIMHINEQTPASLKKMLKKHGYQSKIWLEKDTFYERIYDAGEEMGGVRKLIAKMISYWPLRLIFFNEIYAKAWKK